MEVCTLAPNLSAATRKEEEFKMVNRNPSCWRVIRKQREEFER